MRRLLSAAVLFVAALGLTACGGIEPETFEGETPRLVLEDYFAGKTRAYGIFEDRFGELRRRFTVDIEGTWDGKTLTLDERFDYADGETDRRVWEIEKRDAHTYAGTAGDVVGTAVGKGYGNLFTWSYEMDLDVGDSTWRVTFDDRMYLMADGILMNRASVTRFGIEIGTVTIVFVKPDADMTEAATLL